MLVVKYMNKFKELKVRCKGIEDPCQTPSRFKSGLRVEIRNQMVVHHFYDVDEAFQISLKIEKSMWQPRIKKFPFQIGEITTRRPIDLSKTMWPAPPYGTTNWPNGSRLNDPYDPKGKAPMVDGQPKGDKRPFCFRC
uniref:Uncharacterized protein n=1 Tax=Nelumbo nucifera TaxID=4432 RepID=A0A822YC81_NELNU|nr:TPA_asm: hypothetical protein HUJ06_030144 [Nelumbo nucifera]